MFGSLFWAGDNSHSELHDVEYTVPLFRSSCRCKEVSCVLCFE